MNSYIQRKTKKISKTPSIYIAVLILGLVMMAGVGGATDTVVDRKLENASNNLVTGEYDESGSLYITGSGGEKAFIYDPLNNYSLVSTLTPFDQTVQSISYKTDEDYVAIGQVGGSSIDGKVFIYEEGNWSSYITNINLGAARADDLAWQKDGNRLLVLDRYSDVVHVINTSSSSPTSWGETTTVSYSNNNEVSFVWLQSKNRLVIPTGTAYSVINTSDSDPSVWSEIATYSVGSLTRGIKSDPNGNFLAISDEGESTIHIVRVSDWSVYRQFSVSNTTWGIDFSPNTKSNSDNITSGYLLVGEAGGGYNIERWDLGADSKIETISNHSSQINYIDFTPKGKKMASTSGDNTAVIWSTSWAIPGHVIKSAPSGFSLVNSSGYDLMNDSDVSAHQNTTIDVWVENGSGSSIASFPVNFSASDSNASSLNGSTGTTEGYGYSWITVNETEMNIEGQKTLYVPVENNSGSVCVLNESTNESEVKGLNRSNCNTSYNGTIQEGLNTTGTYYEITGLDHSGAKEIQAESNDTIVVEATTTSAPGLNPILVISLFVIAGVAWALEENFN